MTMFPLFVYGTLRHGGELHDLLRWSVVTYRNIGGCYVPGCLHRHPYGDYPVLRTGEELTKWQFVMGDLFMVDNDNRNVQYVLEMEKGAGYSLERAPVYDRLTHQKLADAVVFSWKQPHVGPLIPSGDWLQEVSPSASP